MVAHLSLGSSSPTQFPGQQIPWTLVCRYSPQFAHKRFPELGDILVGRLPLSKRTKTANRNRSDFSSQTPSRKEAQQEGARFFARNAQSNRNR